MTKRRLNLSGLIFLVRSCLLEIQISNIVVIIMENLVLDHRDQDGWGSQM